MLGGYQAHSPTKNSYNDKNEGDSATQTGGMNQMNINENYVPFVPTPNLAPLEA